MKKALSILLVLMLLLSLPPAVLASEETAPEPEAAEAPAPTEEVPAEEAAAPAAETPAEAAPAADGNANSGQCGKDVSWEYDDWLHTLTVYGEGEMYDLEFYYFKDKGILPEKIVIQEGVTHIGKRMFGNNYRLKTVQIPSTVQTIGDYAFFSCFSLSEVVIPEGVTRIEDDAFESCGMEYVSIPTSVQYIGIDALKPYTYYNPNAKTPVYYSGSLAEWNSIYHGSSSQVEVHCSLISWPTVTFNAMGGTVSPASAQTGDDFRLTSLPTPTRSGYVFDGWFTESDDGVKVDTSWEYKADTTIYAHWIKPRAITRVDLASVSHPVTGHYLRADAKLAAGSHCTIVEQYWTEHGEGDEYTGKAKVNRTYDLYIGVLPDAGYTFGPVGTEVPVYLNGGRLAVGTVTNAYGYENVLLISWDYTTPPMYVSTVELTVTEPEAGAPVVADGAAGSSKYWIEEQGWYLTESTFLPADGTFRDGGRYYYSALLKTKENSRFIRPDDGRPGDVGPDVIEATINGLPASRVYWEDDTIRVFIPFTVGDVYEGPVSLTGPTAPAIGRAIRANGSAGGGAYIIESQGWYEDLAGTTPVTDTSFLAGKGYVWICRVRTGGLVFPDSYKGPVTVNGKTVGKMGFFELIAAVANKEDFGYYAVDDGALIVRMYYYTAVLGDADSDGKVTPADAAMVIKSPGLCAPRVADVDGSGKVDARDAALILHHCAGKLVDFPAI